MNTKDSTSNSTKPAPQAPHVLRPVIRITTDITDVVDQGQAALLALPHAPVIFERARRLAIIARAAKPPKWLHRPQDAPVIVDASPARLRELASRAALWQKHDARHKKKESENTEESEWVAALPPTWFVETLQGRPSWPFPLLEGVIDAPTLRPDGSVLDKPGYDTDTGLWYARNGMQIPPLLAKPTIDDARKAIKAFHGILQDFPFVSTGRAAAIAALLSIVCRFTVHGSVPLFAVRSSTRGSGKGLLIDALSVAATGRPAPRWPQSDDDAEDRKRLLTVALAGDPVIHIDNMVRPLGSPALDLALTAPSVKDRLLGTNAEVEAPLNMVWFASGNNLQLQGDMARRVVPITIDAGMEHPEERTGFAYPNLLAHIRHARPALVWAALTIVQAYMQAQKPSQGLSAFGSFQEWSDLIRSAVVWVGEGDPCEGRKDLEAQSDPAVARLATLLDCWQACYAKPTAVTLKHVLQDIDLHASHPPNEWNDLREALSEYDPKYRGGQPNAVAVGKAFHQIAGIIRNDKRFVRVGERTKYGYAWAVVDVVGVVGVVGVDNPNPSRESVKLKLAYSEIECQSTTLTTPTTPDSEAPSEAPSPATIGSSLAFSENPTIPPTGAHPTDAAVEVLSSEGLSDVGAALDRFSTASTLSQPVGGIPTPASPLGGLSVGEGDNPSRVKAAPSWAAALDCLPPSSPGDGLPRGEMVGIKAALAGAGESHASGCDCLACWQARRREVS